MAQNICYDSKKEGRGHSEEMLDQSKRENQESKLSKSCRLTSNVRRLRCLFPSSLSDCSTLLLGWFYSLLAALLGRYLMALVSSGLQCNLCFTFRVIQWPL